jgi:hypothetical protein
MSEQATADPPDRLDSASKLPSSAEANENNFIHELSKIELLVEMLNKSVNKIKNYIKDYRKDVDTRFLAMEKSFDSRFTKIESSISTVKSSISTVKGLILGLSVIMVAQFINDLLK